MSGDDWDNDAGGGDLASILGKLGGLSTDPDAGGDAPAAAAPVAEVKPAEVKPAEEKQAAEKHEEEARAPSSSSARPRSDSTSSSSSSSSSSSEASRAPVLDLSSPGGGASSGSAAEAGAGGDAAGAAKVGNTVSTASLGAASGYSVKDFVFGDTLGEGSFGRVVVATEIATGNKYAAKILEKKHIIKENKVKYVKAERNILNMLDHHSVVKLFCTFQDTNNLYLVMEIAEGGELFKLLRRVTLPGAKFYSAEITCVLEYLESQGIVHRDLKPENILLDSNFHVKLTDFGTAKVNGDVQVTQRNTFCGTPEYVSPEVLRDQEATKAADLWALGCVIYQLIAHRPPFRADSEYLLFQKILAVEYTFPENFPEDAKDLVSKLLVLDPLKRIGMGERGYKDIFEHPYFQGIDFSTLYQQKPPDLLPESAVETVKKVNAPPKGAGGAVHNEARAKAIAEQKTLPWAKFVFPNELIVRHGLVLKRKGLSSKKRQLILTDYPRVFYVDPEAMLKKGDIPWSANLKAEAKGERHFLIHTPTRTYKLESLEGNTAVDWVDAISGLQNATQKTEKK